MRISSVQSHLASYSIHEKRSTTVRHAFASAIAPADTYREVYERIGEALQILGQDPQALMCVYCDAEAETWDHVYGLVRGKVFSGYGHVMGNLVPCCRHCNSLKGNRNWREFIMSRSHGSDTEARLARLDSYFAYWAIRPVSMEVIRQLCPDDIAILDGIQESILGLMKQADSVAERIRTRLKAQANDIGGLPISHAGSAPSSPGRRSV